MRDADESSVDRELAALNAVSPGSLEWLEPSELRRKARNRRLRRRGGGAVSALAVVVLVATLVSTSSTSSTSRSIPSAPLHVATRLGSAVQLVSDTQAAGTTPNSASSAAVAASEQQFSLALLEQISASTSGSPNVVVSPLSLATALAMLELGAEGATETQIAHVLGTGGLTPEQQAAGWAALSTELAATRTSSGIALRSANSLWLQKGLAMDPTFMSDLSRYFASGVWQVDFASDPVAAVAALNTWVSWQTDGHITSLFAPGAISRQTALILANAVYFDARWKQPFLGTTGDEVFHLPSGSTVSVPFVRTPVGGPIRVPVSKASGTDVVQLPYVGGRTAAVIVMPTSESLSDLTRSLTPSSLDRLVSGMKSTSLDLAMPALALSDTHELIPILQRLGMRNAFGHSANLTGMSPIPLTVGDVVQRATLDVTAWGTVATAATGASLSTSAESASVTLEIDHPFLFLVRDSQTGTILFEAQVNNPQAG